MVYFFHYNQAPMEAHIEDLRYRYGTSYQHFVDGLKRQISSLQPFRNSYLAMQTHYQQVCGNLKRLQEYIQYQQQLELRSSDGSSLVELSSQSTTNRNTLCKLQLQKQSLEKQKSYLKTKIDKMSENIHSKMQDKEKLLNVYRSGACALSQIKNKTSALYQANEGLCGQIQISEDQNKSIIEQKIKISNFIGEITKDNSQLEAQCKKQSNISQLRKSQSECLSQDINLYINKLIPQKKTQKDELFMVNISLKKEIDSKNNRLALAKSEYQLECTKNRQIDNHTNNILRVTSEIDNQLMGVSHELENEILPSIYSQEMDIELKRRELANIHRFIQDLETTNKMMLEKMAEICGEDRKIVENIFYDKCRMVNEATQRVQTTGSIVRQKKSQPMFKDISNQPQNQVKMVMKSSNSTGFSQGQNMAQ